MNFVRLVKKVAYRSVVVECIDNVSNVLAEVNLLIPISCKKLRGSVYEVRGEYLCNNSLFVRFIHVLESVAEEAKRSEHENSVGALALKLLSNVDYGVSGGDHIVDNNYVLAFNIAAKIFVSNDGVSTFATPYS